MNIRPQTKTMRGAAILVGLGLAAATAALALWAAIQLAAPAAPQLTTMLPQGALLTVEAKDFSALLKRWNTSPEQQAWLKSENHSVFSNSRLYSRLGEAQTEFARAAGLPPDSSFLNEVAGTESVFAWYDIGRLEFLYITRMPAGQAEKTRLVQLRGKFTTRQAGGHSFYVRNTNSPGITLASATDNSQPADAGSGELRTVAFATVGDWLLLATREDLMAGALMLMSPGMGDATTAARSSQPEGSLASEPWFSETRAAAQKDPGDLRMTLNLDRIVPTAYFRSYWVQRNITEMKQFRSAVADLYLDAARFREERVLFAKNPPDSAQPAENLRTLTALVPEHAGVYRVIAAPGTEGAITTLDEKLLARSTGAYNDSRYAPQADVSVQNTGSASDLETRIDVPTLATPSKGSELDALRGALDHAGLTALMTVSRTGPIRDGVWVPFASAVLLDAAKPWDQSSMQSALRQAVAARLTAGNLGLDWKSVQSGNAGYFEISDTRPLELAFRGNLCILTDSPALMREILSRAAPPAHEATESSGRETLIAGFDLTRERAPFARWTSIVDRVAERPAVPRNTPADASTGGTEEGSGESSSDASDTAGGEPGFFSRNLRSLGVTFSALQSEQIVERRDGPLTRQTVTYVWKQ